MNGAPRISLRAGRVHRSQRGFALLLVFLLAATVAFSLYRELPRVAFESARNREQLLIDRGGQFKRAIEVYYAVNKKYPATIDDLEKGNDKRFLRHRYKDPLTGADEWRLIHTNGSFLTDSLVHKPPTQNAANGQPVNQGIGGGPLGANNLNTAPAAPGSNTAEAAGSDPNNPNGGQAAVNPAALRRPSDLTGRAGGFDQNNQQDPNQPNFNAQNSALAGFGQPNFNPNDPSTWPAITLAPAQQPQQSLQQFGPQGNPLAQLNAQNSQNNNQFNPLLNGQLNGQATAFANQSPGFPNQGNVAPTTIPGFGGQPQITQNVQVGQQPLGGQIGVQPNFGQGATVGVSPQAIPGQFPGLGGSNPQPNPFAPANPLDNQANLANQQATALAQQQAQIQSQTAFQAAFPGQTANQPPNFNPQNFNQQNTNQQTANRPAFNVPGFTGANPQGAASANNAAIGAINNALFNPQNQNGQTAGGNLGSPGIAGVASKFEGPSIMSYGERTKYQEWEFVFDPAANRINGQQQNPQQNANGQQNQNTGLTGVGSTSGSGNNGLGNATGSGSFNLPGFTNGSGASGSQNNQAQPNPFGQQPISQPQGSGQSPLQGLFGPGR